MNILNLGTYPPKKCGIATFSMDLRKSLLMADNNVDIIAISDPHIKYDYPSEVTGEIQQEEKNDYTKIAKMINNNPAIDLVLIQHEYGIYGGKNGEYILDFCRFLQKPYFLITHTVLNKVLRHQKQILNKLCQKATGIIAMTENSAELLAKKYSASPDKIKVIAHGVPVFKTDSNENLKEKYRYENKQIISTFGLIGPGKGLSLGIKAIKEVSKLYPEALYLILGQTHPMLKEKEGEKYRNMLMELVRELKLEDNVTFVNKYLSDEEIGEYLYMSDIYLSPYPNKEQAVSGTLAFALGCGRAIVSTSYIYANEVLSENRGLIASNTEPLALATEIKKILADDNLKHSLQDNAYALGKEMMWPNIGKEYSRFLDSLINNTLLKESNLKYAEL